MGDISKNFSYEEFFVSRDHPELASTSFSEEQNNQLLKEKLKWLAFNCLQPTRDYIGKPIKILSGFRSEELNTAVGGVKSSEHLVGMAADFTTDTDLYLLFKWAIENLCYRTIIYYPELKFIHVGVNYYDKSYRHSPMVKVSGEYKSAAEYFISKG